MKQKKRWIEDMEKKLMKIAQISLIQGQVHMTSLFNMTHKPKLEITQLDFNRKKKLRVTPLDPKVLNSFNLNG